MTLASSETIVIGLPVYNEATYLAQAIRSLKAQTFKDFTVLIGDNASQDATAMVAEEAIAGDRRFHYHRHDRNIGALGNFSFLLHASQSPLFMWLGGHDMLAPTFLEKNVAAMQADPSISLSYSYIEMVDADGVPIVTFGDGGAARMRGSPMLRYVQAIRYAYGHQVNHVMRRDAVIDFDFQPIVIWDLVLLSHLAFKGRFNCVPEPLYTFRDLHPQLSESSASIMERITGSASPLADQRDTLAYYLGSFDRLAEGNPLRRIYRSLLQALVIQRLMPDHPGIGPRLVRRLVRWKQQII